MSIHECFAGLRDRLGVRGVPVMVLSLPLVGHTGNTTISSGVPALEKVKSHTLQCDKNVETPATPGTPPYVRTKEDWRDMYEERAAIMEFDGGLSRADAEHAANEFIQQQMKEDACHVQDPTMH
jgi:hypothetical protein